MSGPAHDLPLASSGPRPARWTVLWLATFQQVAVTFVRFGLPALAPFFRPDLALSLSETGLLLGIFDVGAVLTFYLTGRLTRRFGERAVLAGGAFLTGILSALAAGGQELWQIALLLALAGTGFPSSPVAGSQAVVDWFPARERGMAMGVRQAGLPIGGFAAAAVLPWLATAAGWRVALAAGGGVCVAAGLAVLALLPASCGLRDEPGTVPLQLPRGRVALATLAGNGLIFVQFCLTGYLPLFLVDAFAWERAARSRRAWRRGWPWRAASPSWAGTPSSAPSWPRWPARLRRRCWGRCSPASTSSARRPRPCSVGRWRRWGVTALPGPWPSSPRRWRSWPCCRPAAPPGASRRCPALASELFLRQPGRHDCQPGLHNRLTGAPARDRVLPSGSGGCRPGGFSPRLRAAMAPAPVMSAGAGAL